MSVVGDLWRDAQPSDAIVVVVLENKASVTIMQHELTTVSPNPIPADKVATSDSNKQDLWVGAEGKMLLVTHRQLKLVLASGRPDIQKGLKVAVYLGCGKYTVSMLSLCVQLHHWVTDTRRSAQEFPPGPDGQKELLTVYTISNLDKSPYLEVDSTTPLFSWGANSPNRFTWHSTQALDDVIATLAEEATQYMEDSTRPDDQAHPKQSNRVAVCISKSVFEAALTKLHTHNSRRAYLEAAGNDAFDGSQLLEYLFEDRYNTKMIHLGQGTEFVGTFKNIGTVLVWPCMEDIYFDTRSSQMVWREDIRLSKAELRHAARLTDNGSTPKVICFLPRRKLYDSLPELPQTAPAFAGDFLALLMELCAHGYFVGEAEPPIRLPRSSMVMEYSRRLRVKGLVHKHAQPVGEIGNRSQVTDFGIMTMWWHQVAGIGNLNVACLLGAISVKDVLTPKDLVRASALMRVAAATLLPGSHATSPIYAFLRFSLHDDSENSESFVEGLLKFISSPNAELARRGPIWAAVGIWSTLRPNMAAYDLSVVNDPYIPVCDGQLHIRLQILRVIEANFALMQQAWQKLGKPRLEFDPALEPDDILFVEKVMVRAWLHNLAFIPMSQQDISPDFAYDIVSGIAIDQKTDDYVHWGWLQGNLEATPPEGEDYAGMCAIYTHLQQKVSDCPTDAAVYNADNLTYVSTKAVGLVFREVIARIGPGKHPRPILMHWQNVLRTGFDLHVSD